MLGGGKPDEDGVVDVRGQQGGSEYAGDVEPLAAEPAALAGEDAVDAEPLGRGGAEYRDGLACGGSVEVVPLGDACPNDGQQAEAGGLDAEGVGVDGRDQRAAVDVDARDRAGVFDLG
jgi:hypothetical protein